MGVSVITKDRSSSQVQFCLPWLRAASKLREILYAEGAGFDPFSYNETAAVGHLVAAAGRAGYVALPEFTENNRKLPEGRFRAGRCDLWLALPDQDRQWVMEFKACKLLPGSKQGLITPMDQAMKDVVGRDRREAHDRWGCVIYSVDEAWSKLKPARKAAYKSLARIEVLAHQVDLAFKFNDSAGPAYLLMQRLKRNIVDVKDAPKIRKDVFADE